jgi:hypothetical protein
MKLTPATYWRLAEFAIVLVGGVYVVHSLNGYQAAKAELARQLETAHDKAAGLQVEIDAGQKQLDEAAAVLAAHDADFASQLDAARHALPGSRVSSTLHAQTAPLQCATEHPGDVDTVPLSRVALTVDQRLELRVDEATLTGRAGSRVVVGALSAWILGPPDQRLAGGPYSVSATEAAEIAPVTAAPGAGWSYGPMLLGTPSGISYGAMATTPRWTVLGVGLGLAGSAAVGASGVSVSGGLLVTP